MRRLTDIEAALLRDDDKAVARVCHACMNTRMRRLTYIKAASLLPISYNQPEIFAMNHKHLIRTLCSSVLLACTAYISIRIHNSYAVSKHILRSQPDSFFEWRGLKVFYRKLGSGSPVILLHALHPAASAEEWSEIIDRLAETHSVYVLDLPGCGRSDKPKVFFTSFFYVSMLKSFIEKFNIKNPVITASNTSALIALLSEAYDPGLISKIILVNPPSPKKLAETPNRSGKFLMSVMTFPLIGSFIYMICGSKQQIDLAFTEKYFYNPFHDNDHLVDTWYESAHLGAGNGRYLYASLEGRYLNNPIYHFVKDTSVPIKIIEGASTDSADTVVQEWKNINSGIICSFIPHTKQLPHLEEPCKVVEEILTFTTCTVAV